MGVGPVTRKAIFLDRDGVLNRAVVRNGKPYSPVDVAELEILPGVARALADLRKGGFLLVVVSNQPEVARGNLRREDVQAFNGELLRLLPLDDVRICCHDDADGCECRKPLPGMILDAAEDLEIDLAKSYMVGDRWRDIEAGRRAGCKTVLIDYGYCEDLRVAPDFKARSLSEAAKEILDQIGL